MSYQIKLDPKSRKAARFISLLQKKIQKAFVATGKTQQEVATILGVDRSVINRRLTGSANLTARSIAEFAHAFDKDVYIEFVDRPRVKQYPLEDDMANYYGFARSNYVRFDPEKLKALAILFGVETWTRKDGLSAIGSIGDEGTPGRYIESEDELDEDEIKALETLGLWPFQFGETLDLLDVVHLAFADDPGGLFVWQEVGYEKLRYLVGTATAIDATGEVVHQISIGDIHAVEDVNTRAEY